MADNFSFDEGTGKTGAADEIAGVLHQRVKIEFGADGEATDVSAAAPLPVTLPDSQITTLTPPAAITNFANETGGNLAAIKAKTDNIPADPAREGGNLASIKTNSDTLAGIVSGGHVQADIVGALPAGTNAIGKVLPPDVDVTTHTNYTRKYYTNTGAVTDGIIWSPAAGKRWHVTSLYVQISADATITIEDDKAGGDDPVIKGEFKAGSGFVVNYDPQYPLASGEDAADLLITTSAGNVYVTAVGYEI